MLKKFKLIPTWKQFLSWSIPSKVTYIGVILTIMFFIFQMVLAPIFKPTSDKKEIELLSEKIDSLFQKFTIPDDTTSAKFPGFSTHLVIKLFKQDVQRSKYIFDLGESLHKNRVSLYLDKSNILTYRLIDMWDEQYSVKIPEGNSGYSFNDFMYLNCEYGVTEFFSFMKIFIDGKLIEKSKYKFKIPLPTNIQGSMTLAADLSGLNNCKMEIAEYIVYKGTLDYSARKQMTTYLFNKYDLAHN